MTLRIREVGLRVALGALASDIVWHFLWRALRIVGIASLAGVGLFSTFNRLLSGMLFGVSPFDPVTLLAVVSLVIVAAASAAVIPSARAARVDPVRTLREE